MNNQNWLQANLEYGRELASSALKGADSARFDVLARDGASELSRAAKNSWQPAVIGAVVGGLVAYLVDQRKSGKTALAGGLVGAALGFSGGVIWGSRNVTGPIAKGALRQVNQARDKHWLVKNPVIYG